MATIIAQSSAPILNAFRGWKLLKFLINKSTTVVTNSEHMMPNKNGINQVFLFKKEDIFLSTNITKTSLPNIVSINTCNINIFIDFELVSKFKNPSNDTSNSYFL